MVNTLEEARKFAEEQCEKFSLESLSPRTNFLAKKGEEKSVLTERVKIYKRLKDTGVFDVTKNEYIKPKPRLIGNYTSFFQVSSRILECQCPLHLDTFGGFCVFNCIYCFAQLYGQTLYAAYFDNWNPNLITVGDKEDMKKQLTSLLEKKASSTNDIQQAFQRKIPIRIGTRSECFQPLEKREGISLEALKILKDHDYPVIINTKSNLILEEPYFSTITSFGNKLVIQETISTPDDAFSKLTEPGAPSSSERFDVVQKFNEVGIRAFPRLEPASFHMREESADREFYKYLELTIEHGAKMVLSDTYHSSVCSPEILNSFFDKGLDYDRMFYVQAEYQELGAAFEAKMLFEAKKRGLLWSPSYNFQLGFLRESPICCGIEDREEYNKFNTFTATNEVIKRGKLTWKEFLELKPLNEDTKERMLPIWNLENSSFPWSMEFGTGVKATGYDSDGNLYYERDFEDDPFLETLKYLGDKYEK